MRVELREIHKIVKPESVSICNHTYARDQSSFTDLDPTVDPNGESVDIDHSPIPGRDMLEWDGGPVTVHAFFFRG